MGNRDGRRTIFKKKARHFNQIRNCVDFNTHCHVGRLVTISGNDGRQFTALRIERPREQGGKSRPGVEPCGDSPASFFLYRTACANPRPGSLFTTAYCFHPWHTVRLNSYTNNASCCTPLALKVSDATCVIIFT